MYVAEMLLEVRDAKVQQKKALYVTHVFYFAFALALTRWPVPLLPTLGVDAYPAVHANTSIGNGQISQTPDRTRPIFDQTWWSGCQETMSNFQ